MSGRRRGISTEQEVYQALTKTFLLLDDFDRRFFAGFGLSTRQYWALTHLDQRQGRPMAELGQLLLTDKSNVTGIVDRLEQGGLVRRTIQPSDRRVILIKLTAKGRRLREQVEAQHEARVRALMSAIDAERLQALRAQLALIAGSIESELTPDEPAPEASATA
jgi:DNA-binding MarR family transcriptional regulator